MGHAWFVALDLCGTFAFALSGATASIERRLDLFGVVVVAYATACGGGILRDLCIGALPPAGIAQWSYGAVAVAAVAAVLFPGSPVRRVWRSVLLFDAIGLGFFAVTGASRAFAMTGNVEAAVVLGVVTAVGGGVVRDILLNRMPVILQREIYALAALIGATLQIFGQLHGWNAVFTFWVGAGSAAGLRLLALRLRWSLPVLRS